MALFLSLSNRVDLDFREVYAINREKQKIEATKPFPDLLDDDKK